LAAVPVAIFGIAGRMGQSLIRALHEEPELRLSGAIASPGSQRLGLDASSEGPPTGVLVTADAQSGEQHMSGLQGAAVAVDFSLAAALGQHVRACVIAKIPLLIGTTGFDAAVRAQLESAAREIPVLVAPNTSVGVSVLSQLVAVATAALGATYEVEISEAHHQHKRDAPSGTAISLGEVVAGTRGQTLGDVAVYDRARATGPRAPGSIGFSVLRAGDIVGEHTVTFATGGERLEFTHRATDRMTFARGALRAARWLVGRPAGLYGMKDVLGF
jgi:4-hydroxy-tetrahydrodipicolinate reductase